MSTITKAIEALHEAEAALSDIGDADREPTDDVEWCEERAAEALPQVRDALKALREMQGSAEIEAMVLECLGTVLRDAERWRHIAKSASGTIRLDGDRMKPDDFRWAAPVYISWSEPDHPLQAAIDWAIADKREGF